MITICHRGEPQAGIDYVVPGGGFSGEGGVGEADRHVYGGQGASMPGEMIPVGSLYEFEVLIFGIQAQGDPAARAAVDSKEDAHAD